jgi:hypothetical protein
MCCIINGEAFAPNLAPVENIAPGAKQVPMKKVLTVTPGAKKAAVACGTGGKVTHNSKDAAVVDVVSVGPPIEKAKKRKAVCSKSNETNVVVQENKEDAIDVVAVSAPIEKAKEKKAVHSESNETDVVVQENKDDAINAVAIGAPIEKAKKKKAGHSKINSNLVVKR